NGPELTEQTEANLVALPHLEDRAVREPGRGNLEHRIAIARRHRDHPATFTSDLRDIEVAEAWRDVREHCVGVGTDHADEEPLAAARSLLELDGALERGQTSGDVARRVLA